MPTSTLISFSAIDYKGEESLSSYALSITPFTLIPQVPLSSSNKLVWDFGDGTRSQSFSATKFYIFPGQYTITLIEFDCWNNAQISDVTKTVTVLDYLSLAFDIDAPSGSTTGVVISAGAISGPFGITTRYPWHQQKLDVFYDFRRSASNNLWNINSNKFYHLENFNTLYSKEFNFTLSAYFFKEIPKIVPSSTLIYARVKDGVLSICSPKDEGAAHVGLSGRTEFYIKDDVPLSGILINFKFDKTNISNPYTNEKILGVNILGLTLSAQVVSNQADHLNITSNGVDGEGFPIDSFDISPIKVYQTSIPFVVKIKDPLNFSVKNFDKIELSALSITLSGIYNGVPTVLPTSAYTISSLNYTLSAQGSGGAFRGFVYFYALTSVLSAVQMFTTGTFTNSISVTYSLSGSSSVFSVYPLNYWDIYKKNEDFNAVQTLKDITFQEILLDKDVLYNDFFGGVLGTNLTHEEIGVKTYEKNANFVPNTQDIDVCEVRFLDSMGTMMDYNDIDEEHHFYPVDIERWVNLLSIDRNKLIGIQNQFRENFDIKGRSTKTEFGINIGDQLDVLTYVVSSTVPIVALEKFGNEYVLLNTYQPISATDSHTYPLSEFTGDWGWPLVLPGSINFPVDIGKYYLFFSYVNVIDGTILDGVTDFNNPRTNIPFDVTSAQLNQDYGIKQHIFMDALYQNLSIIH